MIDTTHKMGVGSLQRLRQSLQLCGKVARYGGKARSTLARAALAADRGVRGAPLAAATPMHLVEQAGQKEVGGPL